MGIEILRIFFRFIILVLVQVALLNNIRLGGYVNPYIYVLFIMLLPVRTPKTLLLVLCFALGLTVDIFSNTLGLHAAASVFLGFARPGILRALSPREGYEADTSPTIMQMGLQWFLIYCVIMVLCHHLVLFYVEVFRFSEFFSTLWRALCSSLATVIVILLSQFLFGSTKQSK
jgi:rod shape-determining protein MreD